MKSPFPAETLKPRRRSFGCKRELRVGGLELDDLLLWTFNSRLLAAADRPR